jgi:hypothetical protein
MWERARGNISDNREAELFRMYINAKMTTDQTRFSSCGSMKNEKNVVIYDETYQGMDGH